MGKDRKKIFLIILLCIFAASLAYRLTHPFKQQTVARLTYQGDDLRGSMKQPKPQNGKPILSDGYVRLDLLNRRLKYSKKVQKNLFFNKHSFNNTTAQPDQQKGTPFDKPDKPVPIEVTRKMQVEQELNDFKSFGYLESSKGITLFLERGKQILVVRKGDRIDGKYIVKDITSKELTLTAMAINEDVHIDISQLN